MGNLLTEVAVVYCITCAVHVIKMYSVERKLQNKC